MSKLEYSLQAGAWTLLGVVLTLIIQRIMNWYRKRNNQGELPPVGAGAYFGSMFILFSIISGLFSYANSVKTDGVSDCQTRINQHNVSVANNRESNLEAIALDLYHARNFKAVNAAGKKLLDNSKQVSDSIPVTSCKK